MPTTQEIYIKSEEVREILAPNSIVRWGVSIVFFIVLLLLLASYFIQYPDIV